MAARFVNVDHQTPLLLPPDLRDWVPPGHLVHFVMDAVAALDLGAAKINERGTGSAQYPPAMMLGLLIYCYATGTFGSRRIETLTHENVAVRYLCADHDSICRFRRENGELLSGCFHQVVELAAGTGVLKVGDLTVSLDGTKLLANASRHGAMSHERIEERMKLATDQIGELLAKAGDADSTPLADGLEIPGGIKRREDRLARLREAKAALDVIGVDLQGMKATWEGLVLLRITGEDSAFLRLAERRSRHRRGMDPGESRRRQYRWSAGRTIVIENGRRQHHRWFRLRVGRGTSCLEPLPRSWTPDGGESEGDRIATNRIGQRQGWRSFRGTVRL